MIALALDEVRALCPGELEAAPWADVVTGVQIDSRRVEEGDLFVAVGSGADFRKHAFARGAVATLVPNDAFAALATLGRTVRDRSRARFVGITGSTGKTSTKDILLALCTPHARTIANERSYNAELGVPLTLCRLEEDTEVCILELAMRGFGQIAALCATARPEIGLVTNVGPAHLALVGSVDGVVRAKSELIEALPSGGVAVVPEDFPVRRDDLEVVRFGEPEADVDEAGTTIHFRGRAIRFDFTARHHARNALAALHAAHALGIVPDDSVEVAFSAWRGEQMPLPGGGVMIVDCWNANPVSMRAALEHLVQRADGRRTVAVLGDMAELGDAAPRYHEEIAATIRTLGIDVVFAVGRLSEVYREAAPVTHWVSELDRDTLVEAIRDELAPGDVVLVKASRAVGLEVVADALAAVRA